MTDDEFKTKVLMKLQSIEEGLWGKPNTEDKGLAGQVREVCESHYILRRHFWMLVAFLVGAGVLAGGGLGISELLKR